MIMNEIEFVKISHDFRSEEEGQLLIFEIDVEKKEKKREEKRRTHCSTGWKTRSRRVGTWLKKKRAEVRDMRLREAERRTSELVEAEAEVAESGRPGRAELLAKRPHSRLRRLSAELENVGEASGKLRPFRTF